MKQLNFTLCCTFLFSYFFLISPTHAQSIEWQQVLGGVHSEYLYDLKATPDYGFLLVGSSFSGKTGNKTNTGQGDLDYFLWKMDEQGRMEWQQSFGSAGNDFLYSANLTKEGGYILGGSSATLSNPNEDNGDKKHPGFGNMDFWIIKLNPEGKEEWQITLGGFGNDHLQSIQQTADGGYILGGSSDSSPTKNQKGEFIGNKSEKSQGSLDYWVVKLSASGEIEWEKTFGGNFSDQLKAIIETSDGYLMGGTSNSMVSGHKTAAHLGAQDFWIVKIDEKGKMLWQNTYGGEGDESLAQMIATENGFLLAGSSNSKTSETKKSSSIQGSDFWVLEIDSNGYPIWDKTYDVGQWDVLVSITEAHDGEFLIGGYAASETFGQSTDRKGIDDYVAIKINRKGEMLWQKSYGGMGSDQLKGLIQMRDGGYLLAGNSDSKKSDDKDKSSIGGMDYWLVKLGNEKKDLTERKWVEVYPNPTAQFSNVVITEDFKEAYVDIFDLNGRKLQSKKLPYRSTAVDLHAYPSGVYIFKITIDGAIEDVKVLKKGNK